MELADRLPSAFAPRGSLTIASLARRHGALAALVVGSQETRLVFAGESYGFHPNMALLRVLALEAGETDRLVEAAELAPGDRFLDCTCGLASDATVAAHVVGDAGAVRALEASPILAAIVARGLETYHHKETALVEAMRRVQVIHADHADLLPTLATDSWDVVYLDPMFETTIADGQGLDIVRLLADDTPPTRAIVDQARRVARQSVVIKDRGPGDLLASLEIPVVSDSAHVWYGRLDAR